MQSVSHPVYTYDATGKLTNYVPSGATNDVVAEHVLLDPRLTGPRSLFAGGLQPTILNSPQLFVPPLSLSSPPVKREKTIASIIGYANTDTLSQPSTTGTRTDPLLAVAERLQLPRTSNDSSPNHVQLPVQPLHH
jgi:hypothetical protein